MLKQLLTLGATAAMLSSTCQAAALTLNGHTYTLTTNTYAGTSNWDNAIQTEFGAVASAADFATLKLDSVDTADTLWNFLVSEGAGAVYIKYQGSQTTDNMPIFMERHATNPGGGWFVIDFIDPGAAGYPDRIDLGRWDIGNQKILAVTTAVPEPAPLAIAGLGLLSLGFFRRRN